VRTKRAASSLPPLATQPLRIRQSVRLQEPGFENDLDSGPMVRRQRQPCLRLSASLFKAPLPGFRNRSLPVAQIAGQAVAVAVGHMTPGGRLNRARCARQAVSSRHVDRLRVKPPRAAPPRRQVRPFQPPRGRLGRLEGVSSTPRRWAGARNHTAGLPVIHFLQSLRSRRLQQMALDR